jgi:hypothetical protein
VQKAADLIREGVHLLVVDLLPPSKRDPQGIQKAIWDEFQEEEFELPPGKPLTAGSFSAGPVKTMYAQRFGVGDSLPDMALFLDPESYVHAPLEAAYQTTWRVFPNAVKPLLEG